MRYVLLYIEWVSHVPADGFDLLIYAYGWRYCHRTIQYGTVQHSAAQDNTGPNISSVTFAPVSRQHGTRKRRRYQTLVRAVESGRRTAILCCVEITHV